MQCMCISLVDFDCTIFPLVEYWDFYQNYQQINTIDSTVVKSSKKWHAYKKQIIVVIKWNSITEIYNS